MKFKEILKKFSNKYIIVTLIFVIILLFIDQNNIFNQIKNQRRLNKVKKQVEMYEEGIKGQQEILDNMYKDSALMERIAREKYMMKRDNEVIYVIEADDEEN